MQPIPPTSVLIRGFLMLAVGLFIVARLVSFGAQREMEHYREMVAAKGGGVIVMSQPVDCIALSNVTARLAERLKDDSVHIQGLIIRELGSSQVHEEATRIANSRFPHVVIGRRAASHALKTAGFTTTPVAIVVDSAGRSVAMKQITDHSDVEDLMAVIGASR